MASIDLSGPSYAGSGAWGCVVWPAIQFPNSKVVNDETEIQQVSKIGVSEGLQIEQDLANQIRAATYETLGVFPVDDLSCGFTERDLGPNAAQIVERCEHVQPKDPFKALEALHLCAIQQPKQHSDMEKYSLERLALPQKFQDQQAHFAQNVLSKKLVHFHAAKWFHGDIKMPNLAIMKPVKDTFDRDSIRLADFGNAVLIDTLDASQRAVDQVLLNWDYFQGLAPSLRKVPIQWNQLKILAKRPTRREKFSFLQLIDQICLIGAISRIFGTEKEKTTFIDSMVSKFNATIDEKLG